jgi:predicted O-methyltransferase YrrM
MNAYLEQAKQNALQVPFEIEEFSAFISTQKPKVVVEIGTAFGGTIGRWLNLPTVETVASIDIPSGVHGGVSPERYEEMSSAVLDEAHTLGKQALLIKLDSHSKETAEVLKHLLGKREIDFLFIDGDHSYEGVRKDFQMYAPMVREGGIIAFHDIRDSEWHRSIGVNVAKLWDELEMTFDFGRYKAPVEQSVSIWPHTDGWGGIGYIVMNQDHFTAWC